MPLPDLCSLLLALVVVCVTTAWLVCNRQRHRPATTAPAGPILPVRSSSPMTMSLSSPRPAIQAAMHSVPTAHAHAGCLQALVDDCDTIAARLSTSIPVLASLTTDMVARNTLSGQQAFRKAASSRSALLARKTRVTGSARRWLRRQCKRIVADYESVDVSTEQLRVWAFVSRCGTAVCPDLDCGSPLPWFTAPTSVHAGQIGLRCNASLAMVFPSDELGSVATGDGLRVASAAGPGLTWFESHTHNEFSVVLAHADGSVPTWLTTADIAVPVLSAAGAPVAGSGAANVFGNASVRVVYGVVSDSEPECVLQLTACGIYVTGNAVESSWRAFVPRKLLAGHECAALGQRVGTLTVPRGYKCGMAVSSDEHWLVVSSEDDCTLSVYSLARVQWVRVFGGRGEPGDGPLQFKGLRRLCFAPNGNLIVVDSGNSRLQEVTLEGVFVRFIGVGEFGDGTPLSVAVHDDVIAVGSAGGTGPRVTQLDFGSGAVLSRFGEVGSAPGQLSKSCTGIRFTPDGCRIIVAEDDARRLSLFTTAGVFVRCVGVGVLGRGSKDVLRSLTGELVVADSDNHRVCVFSPDGVTLLRSFGVGRVEYPVALSAAGRTLYVMDFAINTVHMFI